MKGQQHAVTGSVHVGFQVAVAKGDRLLEGVHAVLAMEVLQILRATAMCEWGKGHIEVGVIGGPHGLIVPIRQGQRPGRRCSRVSTDPGTQRGMPSASRETYPMSPQQAKKPTQKAPFVALGQL